MSKQIQSKRKLLIGVSAVAVAAGVLWVGQYYPPKNGETAGTIVPAHRYQAKQVSDADVALGDNSTALMMQTDSFQEISGQSETASQAASRTSADAASAAESEAASRSSSQAAARAANDAASRAQNQAASAAEAEAAAKK